MVYFQKCILPLEVETDVVVVFALFFRKYITTEPYRKLYDINL
jgi:hypothetical protein